MDSNRLAETRADWDTISEPAKFGAKPEGGVVPFEQDKVRLPPVEIFSSTPNPLTAGPAPANRL